MFIQHADTAQKYQEDAHTKRDLFVFSFKKNGLKKYNFIQYKNTARIQHIYTTRLQHGIYTTQKIQPKVGILGVGLEALRRSPHYSAKS